MGGWLLWKGDESHRMIVDCKTFLPFFFSQAGQDSAFFWLQDVQEEALAYSRAAYP